MCKTISDDLKDSKFNKILLYSSEVSVGFLKRIIQIVIIVLNTYFNNITSNFETYKNTKSSVTNKKINNSCK